MKVYTDFFAQVAFSEFGERENEPLIPFLENLSRFVSDALNRSLTSSGDS